MSKVPSLIAAAATILLIVCAVGAGKAAGRSAQPEGQSAGQWINKKTIGLAAAKKMAAAIEAEAAKNNRAVTVVVVDDGGALIYLERMDGGKRGPMEETVGKARTSAGFGEESKSFKDRMNSGGEQALSTFTITAAAGGVPILVDGQIVGALAVGGAHDELDEKLAQIGLAALEK
jgi:glc operon protein GlcG